MRYPIVQLGLGLRLEPRVSSPFRMRQTQIRATYITPAAPPFFLPSTYRMAPAQNERMFAPELRPHLPIDAPARPVSLLPLLAACVGLILIIISYTASALRERAPKEPTLSELG